MSGWQARKLSCFRTGTIAFDCNAYVLLKCLFAIPNIHKEDTMTGQFVIAADVPRQRLDWGALGWLSHPPATGARQLTVIDVSLDPGQGHNFHKHPDQEEVIFVVSGSVEQWIGEQRRVLGPGDAAFIPADAVHASFTVGDDPAHLLAILGPCVGEVGYELVDVSAEVPWNALRG
jgi:quercetin dioxygenase-like cupin family protein